MHSAPAPRTHIFLAMTPAAPPCITPCFQHNLVNESNATASHVSLHLN